MATWHVTAKPTVGADRTFHAAAQCLSLRTVSTQLTRAGFSVSPMPEQHPLALTVSHSSESALTLFMLKHAVSDCEFTRIV